MYSRRGVTLMEMIVVIGIMLLVAGLMFKAYSAGAGFLDFTQEQSNLQSHARNVLAAISGELRNATRVGYPAFPSIVIPAPPNNTQITFYLPSDNDGNGLITSAAGALEWGAHSIVYQYIADARTITRTQAGVTTTIARNVESVAFEDILIDSLLALNEVQVTLTLSKATIRNRAVSTTLSGILKLRN